MLLTLIFYEGFLYWSLVEVMKLVAQRVCLFSSLKSKYVSFLRCVCVLLASFVLLYLLGWFTELSACGRVRECMCACVSAACRLFLPVPLLPLACGVCACVCVVCVLCCSDVWTVSLDTYFGDTMSWVGDSLLNRAGRSEVNV